MERLIFSEEQSFRQSFVIWIILASCLSVFAIFGYGFYQQLYLGKPWGDQPSSDTELLWTGILTMLLLSSIVIVMLYSRLITEIWSDGVRFRFSPFVRKMRFIPLDQIAAAEVLKYRPVAEYGGWGWRKRLLSRRTAYSIGGRIGLKITKSNGQILMLGTRMPDSMKKAVNKMMIGKTTKW